NGKHEMAGLNNRLSEILAAIGREHIKRLEEFNNHRRKIAETYENNLSEISKIELPFEPKNYKHVYHLYTIKTEKRDELQKFLKERNIGSKVMYPEKLNELEYVKNIAGYQKMPVNDEVNKKILSLPISGSMNLENIVKVCDVIKEFFIG
ncbi:MAG: DegT/DnrJ/EryC1/StrS family aminotransferase, partial [Candidatus Hodarchaeales archaeon]